MKHNSNNSRPIITHYSTTRYYPQDYSATGWPMRVLVNRTNRSFLLLLLVFCCFPQQVNDSHHLAGGSRRRRTAATAARHPRSSCRRPAAGSSWRRRTVATVARHLRSSHRWESCLGKIAEVVSRCLPQNNRYRSQICQSDYYYMAKFGYGRWTGRKFPSDQIFPISRALQSTTNNSWISVTQPQISDARNSVSGWK